MESEVPRASIWSRDPETDLGDVRGRPFPAKLLLSINSHCTLRCTHCVRGHFPGEPSGAMSRERLDSIIQDFFPRVSTVWLGGLDLGEQMQSPHFDYLLTRAMEYPAVDIEMVTSGVALTPARATLIATTMSHLTMSVEGTGEQYTRVRGMRWEAAERRLDWLAAARAQHARRSGQRLRISLHMTVLREHRDDGHALIDLAARWQLHSINFRHFIPLLPNHTASSLLYDPDESNRFFAGLAQHAAEAGVSITMPPHASVDTLAPTRRPCHLPFETMGIHADGRVAACCNAGFDLGHYMPGADNVQRVWSAAPYTQLRATVNSSSPLPACATCDAVNDNPLAYRPTFGLADRAKLRLKQILPAAVTATLRRL